MAHVKLSERSSPKPKSRLRRDVQGKHNQVNVHGSVQPGALLVQGFLQFRV